MKQHRPHRTDRVVHFKHRAHILIEALETRIAPATFTWTGAGADSNWTNAANWHNDTDPMAGGSPNSNADEALFTDSGTAVQNTVTVDATVTVNHIGFNSANAMTVLGSVGNFLQFDNASGFALISQAGVAQGEIDASLKILATAGLHLDVTGSALDLATTIAGAVGSGGLTKTGGGTAILAGASANTYPGITTVSAGTLSLQSAADGVVAIPGDLTITGGSVSETLHQEQIADTAAVSLGANTTLTILGGTETIASLSGSGTLDMQGHRLNFGTSTFAGTFSSDATFGLNGHTLTLTGSQVSAANLGIESGQVIVKGSMPSVNFALTSGGPNLLASLDGSGTVGKVSTTNNAAISPGNNVDTIGGGAGSGQLTVKNTIASSVGNSLAYTFDINGATAGSGFDQFVVSGSGAINVSTQDTATFHFASGLTVTNGEVFKIVDVQNANGFTGKFAGLPEGAIVQTFNSGHTALKISYVGGDGNDVVLVASELANSTLAPVITAKGHTATFKDIDGDTVTLTTTRGVFTAANFVYQGFASSGQGIIKLINLSAATNGTAFKGANITAKVAQAAGGDGLVDIGYLNATGIDLGAVKIAGDITQIDAGDANVRTTGLASLTANSMGALGTTTQQAGSDAALYTSNIAGRLGKLTIAGVLSNVFIDVIGGAGTLQKYGSIGPVSIGSLQADATVLGLPGTQTPTATFAPGTIRASGPIGSVLVSDTLHGSIANYSGSIWSRTSIGAVTLGGKTSGAGSLIGGTGYESGSIFTGNPDAIAPAPLGGAIGTVKAKGSLSGGSGVYSGSIHADTRIGTITIGGNVTGGSGNTSGGLFSGAGFSTITVKGNVVGGLGDHSGSIVALNGNAAAITIAGALDSGLAATSDRDGIYIGGTLTTLTVGSLSSSYGAWGAIVALGKLTGGKAISTVKILGDATKFDIAAGFDTAFDYAGTHPGAVKNPNASIGKVTITGDMADTSITAGTEWVNFVPGGGDDIHLPGDTLPKVLANIASIVIGGQVSGGGNVIEAQKVTAVTIGGVKAALTSGVDNITAFSGLALTEIV